MDRVLGICAVIVAVGGALEVLRRVVRAVISLVRRLSRLTDEVLGDPESGRPGWGDRLAALERRAAATDARIAAVLAEMRPNGGGSLRDSVTRIEQTVSAQS